MPVTTRRSRRKADMDDAHSSDNGPSIKRVRTMTKANDVQLGYLLSVYDSMNADDGQVQIAAEHTGLSEPWIRRWMYREKRGRKRGSPPFSTSPPASSAPSSSHIMTLDTSFQSNPPDTSSSIQVLPSLEFRNTYSSTYAHKPQVSCANNVHAEEFQPHMYDTSRITDHSSLASGSNGSQSLLAPTPYLAASTATQSRFEFVLDSSDSQHSLSRSMTRSPSLGYIPLVFPYGTPAQEPQTDNHPAEPAPEELNLDSSETATHEDPQEHDSPMDIVVPPATLTSLPSVPTLDLLSSYMDPTVEIPELDPSQSNNAYLSQLLQEAEAAYTPLPDVLGYPFPPSYVTQATLPPSDPGPSAQYPQKIPVSVKMDYASLFVYQDADDVSLPLADPVGTHASSSQTPLLNAGHARTTSGSTFNMSFAPSLQSHSTSVYPGGGRPRAGRSDHSTASIPNTTSFSNPLSYLYGHTPLAQPWAPQQAQPLAALGSRRIHAIDSPGKASSSTAIE
ncbi:hypothetical protein BXZ70DRAFT_632354 [Cristinia sonorae]|uniref:Uncharacterized protein n=1 Tax=Cristinia sonorae TaxID=1940300 RepID=A0A8K0UEN8_9AGAR|nr:hypothetical protein BXZ70DRAFT_632354 [Cristinia sonorae]